MENYTRTQEISKVAYGRTQKMIRNILHCFVISFIWCLLDSNFLQRKTPYKYVYNVEEGRRRSMLVSRKQCVYTMEFELLEKLYIFHFIHQCNTYLYISVIYIVQLQYKICTMFIVHKLPTQPNPPQTSIFPPYATDNVLQQNLFFP